MSNHTPCLITVLVHYNNPDECIQLVLQLEKIELIKHQIIIVDNQSSLEHFTSLEQQIKGTNAKLIQNSINGGYGSGINLGVNYGQKYFPDYIQVINTDVSILNPNYLITIINLMEIDKNIGIIGPSVQMPSGEIQNTIMPFITLKNIIYFSKIANNCCYQSATQTINPVQVINGVCMIIRNSAFIGINGFDSDFFMYGEEHDFCYRMQKNGYNIAFWSGEAILHMIGHKVNAKTINWRDILVRCNQILFLKKHNQRFTSYILSFLFSASILLKKVMGYKLNDISLLNTIFYLFNPLKLNRYFTKK